MAANVAHFLTTPNQAPACGRRVLRAPSSGPHDVFR